MPVSVMFVPLASSVICVVTQLQERTPPDVDEAVVCGGELMARRLHEHDG
jgi:hypothetical protein